MTLSIGVMHAEGFPRLPKRELLLFDRIAVVRLPWLIDIHRTSDWGKPYLADEFEFLQEAGYVMDAAPDWGQAANVEAWRENWQRASEKGRRVQDILKTLPSPEVILPSSEQEAAFYEMLRHNWDRQSYETRAYAAALRATISVDAVALTAVSDETQIDRPADRADILRVVVNEFPTPDEETPWEALIDFKRDPDSAAKLFGIREWVREIATEGRDLPGVQDKLKYLLSEHVAHMARHKLKYSRGALEAVVVTGAEIAEDLVKFKWKELAKMLFSIRTKQIELLEAEANSPGNQLAYLLHTQRKFGAA
jgi:hypothetical protein